ncbi:MAG TPA: LysE family transporter [Actinomycetes bacterium]|nr:LysE family transporter [Actinomycetes bacterium]
MGSPGPATVSLAAAGSAYGVRRSLGYLAGIVLGTAVVLVAVAAGITVTLLAVPVLRSVLVALSAAYILWLAYRIATAARPGERPGERFQTTSFVPARARLPAMA